MGGEAPIFLLLFRVFRRRKITTCANCITGPGLNHREFSVVVAKSGKRTFAIGTCERYSVPMTTAIHRTTKDLEAEVEHILAAPKDSGTVDMIVRRPAENQREVVEEAELDTDVGLVGDDWVNRLDDEGKPHLAAQLTLMNSRVVEAMAGGRERWPLAGDQVYVDMDLSHENLPAGTLLNIGGATIRISETPHTGCAKFASRFGKEALRFANVGLGRDHRFRGVNASIVSGGAVQIGDPVNKA